MKLLSIFLCRIFGHRFRVFCVQSKKIAPNEYDTRKSLICERCERVANPRDA